MKVVVIGLGSMGKRRVRLLKKIDSEIVIMGVDSNSARQEESRTLHNIIICENIAEAVRNGATCAFVCASPLAHAAIIQECLRQHLNVFSELNVVSDGYCEIQQLAKDMNKVLFMSSTFLYRSEIKYIQKRVKEIGGPFTYFYHVGQYLPDWHPWEKIQDFFVFDKRTNGCREILVRELPWLTETFGDIASWSVDQNSISTLGLNYPDTYLMIYTHKGGTKGVVLIDVVSRKSSINLEVMSEKLYMTWDGTPMGLSEYDIVQKKNVPIPVYESFEHNANYSPNIIEDAYSAEIEAFFNQVKFGEKPIYDFAKDQRVLDIMDGIEKELFHE